MRLACLPLWVVVFAVAGVGGAVAQEETAPAQPMTPYTDEEPIQQTVLQSLKDFGSFGSSVGGMLFLADGDVAEGALIRPSLQGTFRYRFSDSWVGVGEFGFGWNAFRERGDSVMTVTSGTLGLYRRLSGAAGLDWRLGAGAGCYRWNYKFNGRSLRDSQTKVFYRAFDPGLFAGLEVERRLTGHVTLLATTQIHTIFSKNKTDFPARFGDDDSFTAFRVGINYHFSPYEGILWERKVKRTIRLTSGKAGS